MIDATKASADASQWGISLREWMELQVQVHGNLDVFGDVHIDDDSVEEDWRGRVAQVLVENGLIAKANRYIACSHYGVRLQCKGPQSHALFSPIYCDLRYCPRCGPRQFARLIEKYAPAVKFVCSHHRRDYALREITFTTRKVDCLSSIQIKEFNEDVKQTLKLLMRGVENWGAIWCDEVGFNNRNLHAHVLFYGRYIEQARLADAWQQISGHRVVYITRAHINGPKALLHLLKYVSKLPADDPEIIGELEVAFHGRRRIHALGAFYNFGGDDTDNINSEWNTCPHCGAALERLPGTFRLEKLIQEGRTFVGTRDTGRTQEWVN